MTRRLMSVATAPLVAITAVIASAGVAQAATPTGNGVADTSSVIQGVGLPYTMTVLGLSGGSDGVKSPVFATNGTGKLCVRPNLHNETDASSGSRYNHNEFRIEIYKDNSISDELQRTIPFTLTSQSKACVSSLTTNHNYYIKVKKNKYIEGQTMDGTVVISYT